MKPCGPGATLARRKQFHDRKSELYLPDVDLRIHVASQYQHLGGILVQMPTIWLQTKHRMALARNVFDSARNLLLQNPSLELKTRSASFEVAVATTFNNLGMWLPCGKAWEVIQVGHARLARRLLLVAVEIRDECLLHLDWLHAGRPPGQAAKAQFPGLPCKDGPGSDLGALGMKRSGWPLSEMTCDG